MDFNPAWGNAIASIETGGQSSPYTSVTPNPNGRRALGKYQVMEENLPEWTQAALGKRLTADEYLANPDAQEAVFKHHFGGYVEKYGNPQDAASAWFTGRPQSTGANARDSLGTTGLSYVDKFNRHMGEGPTAIQTAMRGNTGASMASTEDDAPALSPRALVGAGVLVPGVGRGAAASPDQPYDWRGRITQAAAALSGINDPDQAKSLLAGEAARVKDTGTYSLGPVDPQTGIGLRIHNKTGQVTTFQAQKAKDPAQDAYDTAQAKSFSDLNTSIAADADKARAALGNVDTLRAALSNPDVYQGTGAETSQVLKKAGNSLFGMDFKGVADADTATALMNKMTQESRTLNGGMPGSLSDKDLAFLKAANPSLDKSPEANQHILDIYEKLHKTAIERNEARIEYTKGGKMLDDNFNTQQAKKYAARKAEADAADKAAPAAAPATPSKPTFKTKSGIGWSIN